MFHDYPQGPFFDEVFTSQGDVRTHYRPLYRELSRLSASSFPARHELAQRLFLRQGITFTLYGPDELAERTLPFDLVPRVIPHHEWEVIERGLRQRVEAINLFLRDIYSEQKVIRDGLISREEVYSAKDFCLPMMNVPVSRGVHAVLSGIDLIRDDKGEYHVLEDNLRVPSGIAYAFKNRDMMKRVFPEAFAAYQIASLEPFMQALADALYYLSPRQEAEPTVVLLTPGIYNSAYYDHSFLAQRLGIELVVGHDLVVMDQVVYMRTTQGFKRVDVIYRRLDDNFLDPLTFRGDSLIGVAGLFDAYRAGNVAIVNPWGNGVADDKVIYAFLPELIKYYLGEDPIVQNVPTFLPYRERDFAWIEENIAQMVVKPTNASGGYGIFFGHQSTRDECAQMLALLKAHPREYIAQPTLSLSRHPSFVEGRFLPCPIDLRPFVVYGEHSVVMQGGLTRVALRKDSMVVNSSQGGGAKDTWTLIGKGGEDVHA